MSWSLTSLPRLTPPSSPRREVPPWVGAVAVGAALAALVALELRRPLRRSVESKVRRDVRNLAVAAVGAAATMLAERPLALSAAAWVERRRVGLAQWLPLSAPLRTLMAVVALDYTLYWWHVATHRVPWLWSLHKVHHCDRDMDATTALRFHAVDLLVSAPVRVGQVLVAGAAPWSFTLWQVFLYLCILFHHSNVRLPFAWEKRLVRLLVTPRMHGIHHSTVREEVGSNWSSGLTVWDWLHGTLRLNVPQAAVTIGVPGYERAGQVTVGRLMTMPFRATEEAAGAERRERIGGAVGRLCE